MFFSKMASIFNANAILPFRNGLYDSAYIQTRNYAARKGYRIKRRLEHLKWKAMRGTIVKPGALELARKAKEQARILAGVPSVIFNDLDKPLPIDDVFTMEDYRSIIYPFADAFKCHQETHHPTIFNQPDADIYATIELDMTTKKKTGTIPTFKRIVAVQHKFNQNQDRSIIAFSKEFEDQDIALKCGAHMAGGMDLIKKIQTGGVNLQDFSYCIANPNIIHELIPLRGMMMTKFPSQKEGSLGLDFASMMNKFLNGIIYKAKVDDFETEFAAVETAIGTLNMDSAHVEDNFRSIILDINTMKPIKDKSFIRRAYLWSPPSCEQLTVDHNIYIQDEELPMKDELDDNEETDEEDEATKNTVVLTPDM